MPMMPDPEPSSFLNKLFKVSVLHVGHNAPGAERLGRQPPPSPELTLIQATS